MPQSFTVWISGPSQSVKDALAKRLSAALSGGAVERVEVLDQEFASSERQAALRRIVSRCSRLMREDAVAIVTADVGARDSLDQARNEIDRFIEVHVHERDNETGSSSSGANSYGGLRGPDVVVGLHGESEQEALDVVLATLVKCDFISQSFSSRDATSATAQTAGSDVYSEEEEAAVTARLKDLGYL